MYLYATFFILIYFNEVSAEKNPELVISGRGVDAVTPCDIGLKFFIKLNNTSEKHDYEVQVSADQCCLEADGSLDCDVLEILGDCVGYIPKSAIKTVRMVAPILDPVDRRGYCIFYLDSKCNYNGRNMRDTVKINFDTRIVNVNEVLKSNIKQCKNIDEDPLNDCKPIDCDTYYNSRKPHYSTKLKRCVEAPTCISDLESDLPNAVYDPVSNRCVKGKSIKKRDIDNVKQINANHRQPKDILIVEKNNSTFDKDDAKPNDATERAPTCNKCKKAHIIKSPNISRLKGSCYLNFLMTYAKANKFTVIVFGGVIFIQCCLIIGMIYCFTRSCSCFKDKTNLKKIFNYNQDASVTTPLIGTSNIDTETDYRFGSESSAIDKNVKCYKSCEKKKSSKVKTPDDILSTCLCRRNWSSQHTKAEEKIVDTQINIDNVEITNRIQPKTIDTTIVLENEKAKSSEKTCHKIASIPKCLNKEIIDREKEDINASESSERELQCHSYNNDTANVMGFKPSKGSKHLGYFHTEKYATSVSTHKGAQACFSNDSIDDLLSGKGLYIGDDMSKYETVNDPTKPLSSIPVSSKTSKNKYVKNIFSFIHVNRSRPNASSDPGAKVASKNSLNLKILHMSRGSLYSSSNDSECIKQKESRSSL